MAVVVTTTNQATTALAMLQENQDNFDLVIIDVNIPDMDAFKFLELVGLEMDLPVISKCCSSFFSFHFFHFVCRLSVMVTAIIINQRLFWESLLS